MPNLKGISRRNEMVSRIVSYLILPRGFIFQLQIYTMLFSLIIYYYHAEYTDFGQIIEVKQGEFRSVNKRVNKWEQQIL